MGISALLASIPTHSLWVLLVGSAVVAAAVVKAVFDRLGLPALVGYLGLGFGMALADARWEVLDEPARHAFEFLADLGIIALLFRVGLDSSPRKLMQKLPRASFIWVGDVAVSAVTGFAAPYYLTDLGLVPSLVVAAALTATSLGVAVPQWQEARALGSANGQLLVDVGEMDDLSGVAIMALLLSVVPVLQDGSGIPWPLVGQVGGWFLLKLAAFAALCWAFSQYLEGHITRWAIRREPAPGRMLIVLGLGLLIAAGAGWLGFSLAIGALFAGLTFSRDPVAVRTEANFADLYEFLVPFFFIGIGLQMDPGALWSGLGLGALLLAVTVPAKLLGAGLPAWLASGSAGGVLIGVSMVPRAEITMVVVDQGRRLGDWVVPPQVYAAAVVVTAGTCLLTPLVLRPLMGRYRDVLREDRS
ncbi:MAG TPA: cation:proton antiporter [Gammaproteobacteria bacterium]|nr:cation:proton antiporter [Gammaproteobacteria bacterium]